MEKTKSNISQSMRYLTKNKLNVSGSNPKNIKSGELSSNKNKSKKTSLKNIIKSAYLVKKNEKKNNESIMYKTSLCTPGDTTALLSCISTPNAKSQDKRSYLKKMRTFKNEPYSSSIKQNLISTEEGRGSQDSLKIKFTLNSKVKFQKYFNDLDSIQHVKKQLLKQLQKRLEKTNAYFGLIGFYTIQGNVGVDKMLRNSNIKLQEFKQKNIYQLNLKIIMAKTEPHYKNLQFSNFQLIKYLGSGGFSSVYLARCMIDGSLCALKFIKKSSIVTQNKYRMLQNEKNILFTIDHHRLVDLYYAFESKNYIIFGLQYCPNGNLYQLIQKRKFISEQEAKFLFSQILQGLSSLHSQKILFRDMKLQNILFDENGNVKITDFGLSKPQLDEQDITYSYCGSPQYMAPQMLAKSGHSFQIDYYALGILLYQLLYGHSPFFAPKKQDIFHAIMNSEPHFPKFPTISKEAKSLIKGLLQKNPKHRTGSLKGTQQIMSHPWLRGYSTNNLQSPFKIPLKNQNIQIDVQQMKKLAAQYGEDININFKQKVFFNRSFVNKNLAQKLVELIIVLKDKGKQQKMIKSSDKSRNKIK